MLFVHVINYEVSKGNERLATSLDVATSSDNQGVRVSPPGQPEPVARLAVGDMGDCAGVGNVNICHIIGGYDLKSRLAKLAD